MKKRALWMPLATAPLGLGLVMALAQPAAADGWERTVNVSESSFKNGQKKVCGEDGGPRVEAFACFQRHGELFWLKDVKENGNPVVIRWRYYNSDTGRRRAGDIYNNHTKRAGWTVRNKSFAEGHTIRFRVCEADIPDRRVYDCAPRNGWYTWLT